jgi:NADH-quinone oxidoreductase subunit G
LSTLDRVLVVGSFLRKDHPLFAQRLRQAARRGARISVINALADDWAMPVHARATVAPSGWAHTLADVAACIAQAKGSSAPAPGQAGVEAQAIADALLSGERKAILLGNAAAQHPQARTLLALANWIAEQTGASVGYLTEAANSVGAQWVGAMPGAGGLDAGQMLSRPMKALLLLNVEPVLEAADPATAAYALKDAGMVVALTAFRDASANVADVLLPIAPFTETAGSFVNAEGRVQTFHAVVKPLGQARPGWKVLRVLGNLLGLDGFEHETVDEVRAEALAGINAGDGSRLDNRCTDPITLEVVPLGFERVADVPIYATDSIVRRAPALQHTADARSPVASLPPGLWQQLALDAGDHVRITQGSGSAILLAEVDLTLADSVVRVPAGHVATSELGPIFGPLTIEKA